VAAYDQLVAEGYLVARQGAGTVVADLGPETAATVEDRRGSDVRLDLRPGTPDVSSFPVSAWLRSTRRAVAAAPARAYGYGDVRGRRELRAALVDYLGRTRGVHAVTDQVMITSGTTQSLSLLAMALRAAGSDAIAMENPGFAMHRPVVQLAGQRVVSVAVDAHGVAAHQLDDVQAAAFVVTPAHQYPTGVVMHPTRRRALTAWARATGGIVIEDDYDGEFRYERQPIGSLQGTAPEHVVYLGTASKTLSPGVRLGWMVLPHRLIVPLIEVKRSTDLCAPTISQLTLADLITSHGYDRHIRTMRLRYRRRRDLLIESLAQVGPDLDVGVAGVPAGLQSPVLLPAHGPAEDEVVATAAAEGLALEGLGMHSFDDAPHVAGLLVGFSKPSERAYPAAVALLARVLRRML
jgi:GntR family transcriptional regulator/MocR family aminotransferase